VCKNKEYIRFICAIFIVTIITALSSSCVAGNRINYVEIKGRRFYVEVARTPEERHKGLMFRKHLDNDGGMLFVFPQEGRYSFWMKNTYIPLDMIWINKERKIVYIKHNAHLCFQEESCPSIVPPADALYVLEINAGVSYEFGFSPGDSVNIHISLDSQEFQ